MLWPRAASAFRAVDTTCQRYVPNTAARRLALGAAALLAFLVPLMLLTGTSADGGGAVGGATTRVPSANELFVDGVRLVEPGAVKQDETRAVELFREAAASGHVDAMNNLGVLLAKRKESPADQVAALASLLKAAERGHVPAMYNYGLVVINSGPWRNKTLHVTAREAIEMLVKAADVGHPPAMRQLGNMLIEEGRQGGSEFAHGMYWLKAAVDKGDVRAKAFLGSVLTDAKLARADPAARAEGMVLLREAAAEGDVAAMIFLGLKLIIERPNDALSLYEKAMDKNCRLAAQILADLYEKGEFEPQIPRDHEKAKAYRRRADAMTGDDPFLPQFELIVQPLVQHKRAPDAKDTASASAGDVGEIRRFVGHTAAVHCVAFAPGGTVMASAAGAPRAYTKNDTVEAYEDGTVRLWDVATGKELKRFGPNPLRNVHVVFSPSGNELLSVGRAADEPFLGTLDVYDWRRGKKLFSKCDRQLTFGSFSPDGREITIDGAFVARRFRLETGVLLQELRGTFDRASRVNMDLNFKPGFAFSPDGAILTSAHFQDGSIRTWDLVRGKPLVRVELSKFDRNGTLACFALSPDGRHAAVGMNKSNADQRMYEVWIVDLTAGRVVRRLRGHTNHVRCVAFQSDGRRVVSGGSDGAILIWELETGHSLKVGAANGVQSLALSSDGRHLVSGHEDHSVRLFEMPP
ncbi:MAG: hypothetical protein WBD40_22130 [Tepidisphaeraceae bacterium]